METERSSLVARGLETPKKDLQLRVTPSEVKFLDALAGKVYRLPVTVHNLGRCNQKIRFQDPVKPQVTPPGVLEEGPQEGCGFEKAPLPGLLTYPGEWAPDSCGHAGRIELPGDFGVSVNYVCWLVWWFASLFFLFAWGWETGWRKVILEPPNFFGSFKRKEEDSVSLSS